MVSQQKRILWIAILGSFVAFLDGSVINVALPAISEDLDGGLSLQQWVVDSYLITLGALMLIAGSLSDLFGRLKILYIGLFGFAVASVLCAVAPSGLFLVIARGLQGVAGALLVPSSLALIITAFKGEAQGRAIGTWTGWTGIAFLVGPLLGGLLVDSGSWRLIFAINVIPIAYTIWLMRSLKNVEKTQLYTKIDTIGAVLCMVGLGGPVYALIEQPRYGWDSPLILVPLIAGLAAFCAFLWYEKRVAQPMLPLGLFSVRNFLFGNIATVAIYGGLSIATFLIAVFVQQVGGYTALEAGLSLVPVTILMFILAPRFGSLAGHFGPRLFMTAGPFVAAAGFLLMLLVDSSVSYWTQLLPGIIVFGIGLSMTVAPLTSAVLGAIDSSQAGIGSAVNNAVARIAGLVSIAALGVILQSNLDLQGFQRGIVVTALLLIVGGVISAIGIRNRTTRSVHD